MFDIIGNMKEEYPLLFKYFCNEIYHDLNIENISVPTWRNPDINIYTIEGEIYNTPKDELHGWVFNNRVELNIHNLSETERKLKELGNKIK